MLISQREDRSLHRLSEQKILRIKFKDDAFDEIKHNQTYLHVNAFYSYVRTLFDKIYVRHL